MKSENWLTTVMDYKFGRSLPQQAGDPKIGPAPKETT